jgi:hypothetical protein
MTRVHLASLLAFIAAVPATASLFAAPAKPQAPCFVAGEAAYRISRTATADITVRIDNDAARPQLRLQLVDDAAAADFVLVDDEGAGSCQDAEAVTSVRLDAAAAAPDVTVALSRAPAAAKIYVKSARFSEADAAALYAAMRQRARKAGIAGRQLAARP